MPFSYLKVRPLLHMVCDDVVNMICYHVTSVFVFYLWKEHTTTPRSSLMFSSRIGCSIKHRFYYIYLLPPIGNINHTNHNNTTATFTFVKPAEDYYLFIAPNIK